MQYIYILTNKHVPNLVKFGFSTRNPHDRAAELSAPTGVPGNWMVHHYWEVEDGYGVEQAVFRRLSTHRLGKQEFFQFTPDQAVQAISKEIRIVGINPTQKAKQEAEAKRLAAQAANDHRINRIRELEQINAKMLSEIHIQEREIREKFQVSFFRSLFDGGKNDSIIKAQLSEMAKRVANKYGFHYPGEVEERIFNLRYCGVENMTRY